MSNIEQALQAAADSNLKLAAAMNRYADVIENYGVRLLNGEKPEPAKAATDNKPAKAEKPKAEKPKAEKPKAEAEVEVEVEVEVDEFGDPVAEVEVPKKITPDSMKAQVLAVRDAYGDPQKAKDLCKQFGYTTIGEIKAEDYPKVWVACQKAIDAAPKD